MMFRITPIALLALLGPALGVSAAHAEGPSIGLLGRGGLLVPMPGAGATGGGVAQAGTHAPGALPRVMGPPGSVWGGPYGAVRVVAPTPVRAGMALNANAGQACRDAIRLAERGAAMPTQLMAAIARVESGRPDAQGVVHPWPWTINAEGTGSYFNSKAEAIAAVRALQARGVKSIDVGCMQVNLMYHADAFATLEQAFDPVANARYAAAFLTRLYAQTHDWTKATANYHSATPDLGEAYQRRVAAVLPEEMKRLGDAPGGQPNVWSVNAWSANTWNTAAPAAFRGRAGGFMLNNGASHARVIPMAPGATGRGLDSYRAAPVLATR